MTHETYRKKNPQILDPQKVDFLRIHVPPYWILRFRGFVSENWKNVDVGTTKCRLLEDFFVCFVCEAGFRKNSAKTVISDFGTSDPVPSFFFFANNFNFLGTCYAVLLCGCTCWRSCWKQEDGRKREALEYHTHHTKISAIFSSATTPNKGLWWKLPAAESCQYDSCWKPPIGLEGPSG